MQGRPYKRSADLRTHSGGSFCLLTVDGSDTTRYSLTSGPTADVGMSCADAKIGEIASSDPACYVADARSPICLNLITLLDQWAKGKEEDAKFRDSFVALSQDGTGDKPDPASTGATGTTSLTPEITGADYQKACTTHSGSPP
ncbi:hypothetical protein PSTG_00420 [Puccinia striiformis f. sp. tritici PST-78]|uniref:Uncharacterized protein n=1 Tax=Puccinia striiformis f. sp. tritici PST-78 TaxID=1165861 RepID=A0A0L0W4U9_9BASI|nr:hypothetical protein PSTG_00420 [Puccinia striiformis f. sp. tritici PST-78]